MKTLNFHSYPVMAGAWLNTDKISRGFWDSPRPPLLMDWIFGWLKIFNTSLWRIPRWIKIPEKCSFTSVWGALESMAASREPGKSP